jgi:hypothetical protein
MSIGFFLFYWIRLEGASHLAGSVPQEAAATIRGYEARGHQEGEMSVRRLLEKEVLIRLSENGFVETIRYFGLPDRCLACETAEPESMELTSDDRDERLMLVRKPEKRDENSRRLDAPDE